jgi:hypothetical protein
MDAANKRLIELQQLAEQKPLKKKSKIVLSRQDKRQNRAANRQERKKRLAAEHQKKQAEKEARMALRRLEGCRDRQKTR